MILFKIALRNLKEHKTKTLIIGGLIALGIIFLVVGNSVMETVTEGMKTSYSENYTGDLIILADTDEDVEFMGAGMMDAGVLPDYPELTRTVASADGVARAETVVSGIASYLLEEETVSFGMLWGIDVEGYRALFPDSFRILEGSDLTPESEGIVLNRATVDSIEEKEGIRLKTGDTISLSGINDTTGTKIREVTIRGIGEFRNSSMMQDMISFVDAGTLRGLNGLTAVTYEGGDVADIEVGSDQDLFGGGLFTDTASLSRDTPEAATIDFDNILGDVSARDQYAVLDNDAWNFLLVKAEDGTDTDKLQLELAGLLGDDYRVEDWRWGAGTMAEMAYGLQMIFNIIILVISIVAVIIIMNTLVISVTERIPEIGTIRAIGGQKAFVRRMIILETLMISLSFGIVGIIIGGGIILVLGAAGIEPTNMILQVLFGGRALNPVLSALTVAYSLGIVAFIGVAASLYPTSVALGITPLQAMQKE